MVILTIDGDFAIGEFMNDLVVVEGHVVDNSIRIELAANGILIKAFVSKKYNGTSGKHGQLYKDCYHEKTYVLTWQDDFWKVMREVLDLRRT